MKKINHYLNIQWHRFEQFVVDIIYERNACKSFPVQILRLFLELISYGFSYIVQLRYWLYETGLLKRQPLGCLVVVVGNLTVGGTGKTPVVEKFAKSLIEKGRKVAILSRGYKSKPEPLYRSLWRWVTQGESPPPKVVSDGKTIYLDSEQAGDEPYMLARNLPGVIVVVDKNRVKAGHYAIKKYGADTLILDDGFQYLPLKSHLNLLLIDKTNPFGNHYLLPRGILREPVKHLKRASYIFITKSDGAPDEKLIKTIRKHNKQAEIIESTHQPQYLQNVQTSARMDLHQLHGKRVALLSGIASPLSFEQFIELQGADIIHKERFLDHHRFSPDELDTFFQKAIDAHAECIIMTEKDAVRMPTDLQIAIPLYYLRMEIKIIQGVQDFEEAVSKICFPKYYRK